MTCNDVQLMMSAFVDGELDPADETTMFQHIGTCAECQQFFRSLMTVRQSVATSVLLEPGADFDIRVSESVQSLRSEVRAGSFSRMSLPISVAASVTAILLIVSFVMSPALFPVHEQSTGQRAIVVPQDIPVDAQARLARYLQ